MVNGYILYGKLLIVHSLIYLQLKIDNAKK